ncbi:protein transport protein SEC24-like [Acyrthosiphon pisum]|uniref:Uncharacterized protein n=1 Tax=Acyrthosiphon pisum TaxID=7029 RepID=A0A8R2B1C2_ACYPI|nr:protein transport protein SEC24-like [Acyrthosiphon pisum]|eukprot:XP_008178710.1 PREDICTED: protein transport protein SEC24-like [Acyrthosiphon pisum]
MAERINHPPPTRNNRPSRGMITTHVEMLKAMAAQLLREARTLSHDCPEDTVGGWTAERTASFRMIHANPTAWALYERGFMEGLRENILQHEAARPNVRPPGRAAPTYQRYNVRDRYGRFQRQQPVEQPMQQPTQQPATQQPVTPPASTQEQQLSVMFPEGRRSARANTSQHQATRPRAGPPGRVPPRRSAPIYQRHNVRNRSGRFQRQQPEEQPTQKPATQQPVTPPASTQEQQLSVMFPEGRLSARANTSQHEANRPRAGPPGRVPPRRSAPIYQRHNVRNRSGRFQRQQPEEQPMQQPTQQPAPQQPVTPPASTQEQQLSVMFPEGRRSARANTSQHEATRPRAGPPGRVPPRRSAPIYQRHNVRNRSGRFQRQQPEEQPMQQPTQQPAPQQPVTPLASTQEQQLSVMFPEGRRSTRSNTSHRTMSVVLHSIPYNSYNNKV